MSPIPLWLAIAAALHSSGRRSSLLAANKLYPDVVPAFPEEDKQLIRRVIDLENELKSTRAQLERAMARPPSMSRLSKEKIELEARRPGERAAETPLSSALTSWPATLNLLLWLSLGILGSVCQYRGADLPTWLYLPFALAGASISLLYLGRELQNYVRQILGMVKPFPRKIRCYHCRDVFDITRGAKIAPCPYCQTLNDVASAY